MTWGQPRWVPAFSLQTPINTTGTLCTGVPQPERGSQGLPSLLSVIVNLCSTSPAVPACGRTVDLFPEIHFVERPVLTHLWTRI